MLSVSLRSLFIALRTLEDFHEAANHPDYDRRR